MSGKRVVGVKVVMELSSFATLRRDIHALLVVLHISAELRIMAPLLSEGTEDSSISL